MIQGKNEGQVDPATRETETRPVQVSFFEWSKSASKLITCPISARQNASIPSFRKREAARAFCCEILLIGFLDPLVSSCFGCNQHGNHSGRTGSSVFDTIHHNYKHGVNFEQTGSRCWYVKHKVHDVGIHGSPRGFISFRSQGATGAPRSSLSRISRSNFQTRSRTRRWGSCPPMLMRWRILPTAKSALAQRATSRCSTSN